MRRAVTFTPSNESSRYSPDRVREFYEKPWRRSVGTSDKNRKFSEFVTLLVLKILPLRYHGWINNSRLTDLYSTWCLMSKVLLDPCIQLCLSSCTFWRKGRMWSVLQSVYSSNRDVYCVLAGSCYVQVNNTRSRAAVPGREINQIWSGSWIAKPANFPLSWLHVYIRCFANKWLLFGVWLECLII